MDGPFWSALYSTLDVSLQIMMKFGAVIIISPIFSIPGIVMIILGAGLGHLYMNAQLPAKREVSNAKAPVLAHFGSAIGGLGTSYFKRHTI